MKNVEQGAVPSDDSMEGKTDGDKFNGWVILAGTLLVSLIIALFFGYKNPTQAAGVVFAFILFPLVSYGICAGLTKSMFKRPIGGFGSAVSFFTMWGIVAISHISHVINEDIEHQRIVDAREVEFQQMQLAPLRAEWKEIEAKFESLKSMPPIKLLEPVEVRQFKVKNKTDQLETQADADVRKKVEVKASSQDKDTTSGPILDRNDPAYQVKLPEVILYGFSNKDRFDWLKLSAKSLDGKGTTMLLFLFSVDQLYYYYYTCKLADTDGKWKERAAFEAARNVDALMIAQDDVLITENYALV